MSKKRGNEKWGNVKWGNVVSSLKWSNGKILKKMHSRIPF